MLSLHCRNQDTLFRFYLHFWGSFTSTSNKFRMVYKVDGNPQLDSRDWSMYSNILNAVLLSGPQAEVGRADRAPKRTRRKIKILI